MKSITIFASCLAAVMVIGGCYASSTRSDRDGESDAPVDALLDDAHGPDALPDQVPPDASPPDAPPPDLPPDVTPPLAPYALHEWGVISITERGQLVHGPAPISLEVYVDKPVMYLYPDEEIPSLDIGVTFASGAAAEVWPAIPLGQRIEWSDLSLRPGPCDWTPFPFPNDTNPCEVCNLGSCVVEEAGCIGHTGPDGTLTASRLLFYAGSVGDYAPPLETSSRFLDCAVDAEGCMSFTMKNNTSHDIEDIWLIYRQTYDNCYADMPYWDCPLTAADVGFRFIDKVPAGQEISEIVVYNRYDAPLDPTGVPIGDLPLPTDWLDLDKGLLASLVERGLTESEAGAFLRNWDLVFYGLLGSDSTYIEPMYSNGAFAIYFMGPEDYNAQFPLTADPAPREQVRVGMIYQKQNIYYDE